MTEELESPLYDRLRGRLGTLLDDLRLPIRALWARRRDAGGLKAGDPGVEAATAAVLEWLCRAQDRSASADGGVARHYSLTTGWGPSYPETTGYIVPTFLEAADRLGEDGYRDRARRMLDWLVSIQLECGAFQGGTVEDRPVVPVTFNTGQIVLGLSRGVSDVDDTYREPLRRAADWLVETQDEDGAWRSHPSPFARPGDCTYDTHVAWGLLEAERVEPGRGYGEAALRNVRWALDRQRSNGWFRDCCLGDPERPLTHTLGYALRGVIEAYRFSGERDFRDGAVRAARGLLHALGPDGRLPGRLDREWNASVDWVCLTGSLQVAHCWLLLDEETEDARFREAAERTNRFVRRTLDLEGSEGVRGGVRGSFPIDGAYGPYQFLNWAAKFFVDAHVLERRTVNSVEIGGRP